MSGSSTPSTGIGCFGLIGIVLVVLKLTDTITTPWIWVLAPFWGPTALAAFGVVVFLCFVWFTRAK